MGNTLARMKQRGGRSSDWTNINPVLDAGEFGYETDTGKLKLGDGAAAWNVLPYMLAQGPAGPTGPTGATGPTGPTGPAGAGLVWADCAYVGEPGASFDIIIPAGIVCGAMNKMRFSARAHVGSSAQTLFNVRPTGGPLDGQILSQCSAVRYSNTIWVEFDLVSLIDTNSKRFIGGTGQGNSDSGNTITVSQFQNNNPDNYYQSNPFVINLSGSDGSPLGGLFYTLAVS